MKSFALLRRNKERKYSINIKARFSMLSGVFRRRLPFISRLVSELDVARQERDCALREKDLALRQIEQAQNPDQFRQMIEAVKKRTLRKFQDADLAVYQTERMFSAQAIGFMIDIIPCLYKLLAGFPRSRRLEVLDVGSRTGAGANLLAQMHSSYYGWIEMDVDALDIDDSYKTYADVFLPFLRRYLVSDIESLPRRSYDIVICSHTIEHLSEPANFCRALQKLAREFVIIYCPFNESPLYPEHVSVIDEQFIDALDPVIVRTEQSWWWRTELQAAAECALFVLKGYSEAVANDVPSLKTALISP